MSDGQGRTYVRSDARPRVTFTVSGALGRHVVALTGAARKVERQSFMVACATEIDDHSAQSERPGHYATLLQSLRYTMTRGAEAGCVLALGRFYRFLVPWLRDHVHTMKGLRYFEKELTSAIELYRDTQRSDGMVFDNIYPRPPYQHYWDQVLRAGDYLRVLPPGNVEMRRIPVENDVEYLFIEGLYETWKATGDDAFMRATLPAAEQAVRYATTDPQRWSSRFGLLKRGYTIDTWDFQPRVDIELMPDQLSPMTIGEHTRFGVFHGDNTGMAAALEKLGEMLRCAGRASDALGYEKLARELRDRLTQVAWNGQFYTHHVSEQPGLDRGLGSEAERLSLSNAYALNRGVDSAHAAAIVNSYRALRERLPPGCPAEFLTVYPGYAHGFDVPLGEYMNMGVSPIVAGELARGALAHGFEAYGVDILERVAGLAARDEGYLHCCFRGYTPRPEQRAFRTVSLTGVANVDFAGTGAPGVPGWVGDPHNDLASVPTGVQILEEVPFDIIEPGQNGRRGCLGLSTRAGYAQRATIAVSGNARSLYFLHALSGGTGLAGTVTVHYRDGTTQVRHIYRNREITGFWMPEHPDGRRGIPELKVAWEGQNASCLRVGLSVFALDLTRDEEVSRVELTAAGDDALWLIAGLTASDEPGWLAPSPISYGIPDSWGAAAVTQALLEGLAGVADRATAFARPTIVARWAAAGVDDVTVRVTYPSSAGYIAYRYIHDRARRSIALLVAGSGARVTVAVLLPHGASRVLTAHVDGERVSCEMSRVQESTYAQLAVPLDAARRLRVRYA